MKLKTFNTTNVTSIRETAPFMHCNKTTGLFNINRTACQALGLKAGNQIQFHQSEDEESDWYCEVVAKDGFVVRESQKTNAGALIFNSTFIIKKIFESVAFTGKSGRLLIGEEIRHGKQILFTLITGKLRNS